MRVYHVFLRNKFGNVTSYKFDFEDGKPEITGIELVMDYDNQTIDDILEELGFKLAEENSINAQTEEQYCQPNSGGWFV